MPIHLLDLPPELLVHIFYSLDLPAFTALLATNRRVKSIIDDSALLQYQRAARAACVEDNPRNGNLTSAQKLTALQRWQHAFTALHPSSIRTVPMDEFPIQNSYSLSGGRFVMTEADEMSLRWTSLADIEPAWKRLEIGEHIVEFGLADDLLVVISSSNPHDALDHGVKLRLYEMPSHTPHPMAQESIILLPQHRAGPFYTVDVCGPRLSILFDCLQPGNDEETFTTRLVVYDWKRNHLLMDISGDYSVAMFVSADTMLLAQIDTLQLWDISGGVESVDAPKISLKLSQLKAPGTYDISGIESHRSSPSHRPFQAAFADSILALDVEIAMDDDDDDDDFAELLLVVPRRALGQLIQSTNRQPGNELSWKEWGPPIARWLDASTFRLDDWQTITHGQRCAFVSYGCLRIYDFNPYAYRRALKGPDQVCMMSTEAGVWKEGSDIQSGIFGEEIVSQLGYTISVLDSELAMDVNYDGVLMGEEWIVGINDTTHFEGKFSLDVWHMG
ncbi:hypothetical protein C8R46DRAFT_461341 [Mycena filopes]|nr:hypothetical protein C8R46DRAFT_461341 [Mycena filopes]